MVLVWREKMRQQIDCAVLRLAAHRVWLEDVLSGAAPALTRVRLHQLEWEAGQDLEVSTTEVVTLPAQALAQAGISLRRFDLCLVPVSLDTLAWTRQALALIPRGPFLPLVGIFQNLKSAAMQDLLELGMTDFVRLPLCPDEFRARVLTTVSRVPKPGTLREPAAGYISSDWCAAVPQLSPKLEKVTLGQAVAGHAAAQLPGHAGQVFLNAKAQKAKINRGVDREPLKSAIAFNAIRHQSEQPGSFRDAKNRLVSNFERTYITEALIKHSGNIAMAARASNKHRRAFWALMRKHDIAAELYRADDGED
jgi:DNA-binding NtrC family response regulator